jgi:hypothetical protein
VRTVLFALFAVIGLAGLFLILAGISTVVGFVLLMVAR